MSGLTNAWPPPAGGVPRPTSADAYAPCAQLDEKVDSAELIARSEPIADASLPDMRARRRPGTAIAAMMPMIATTISSSMRVKPLESRIFISFCLLNVNGENVRLRPYRACVPIPSATGVPLLSLFDSLRQMLGKQCVRRINGI